MFKNDDALCLGTLAFLSTQPPVFSLLALTYKQLLPLEHGLIGTKIYEGLGGCLLTIS